MASENYSVHGGIAVITLNNPPVNAMGHALREELAGTPGRGLGRSDRRRRS